MLSELKKPMPFGYMGKTQVFSSAQLEQYAADRVREALERAAQECDRLTHALDNAGTSYHRPATADRCARAIRTLKEQTK